MLRQAVRKRCLSQFRLTMPITGKGLIFSPIVTRELPRALNSATVMPQEMKRALDTQGLT